jgi:hypothetical protein
MSYFVKNSNLSSIQDIVNSFTQVITQQNALITALQSGLATGDTNLTTLVDRVTANEATLATHTTNIGSLGTITANNGSAIGVLQSAYTTNRADITTNTTAITALNTAMSLVVARGIDNTAAIAATNTIVSGHTASIAALEVPGFVATPSTLHWDFRDFIDLKQGVTFVPIASDGIEIIDQKAVADLPGPLHFLRGFVPIEFVSKFSKSLMFRFKSIAGMDPNVDFVFSSFSGDPGFSLGFAVRVFNGAIETTVYGGYNPMGGATKPIYSALHPISGYPNVIFDQYVHMTVVINTATGFITSYINGVQAGSTNAVTSGTTQAELDEGEYHAGVSFLPFFLNKHNNGGDGNARYDDVKYFNSAITQADVTHYYNQTI